MTFSPCAFTGDPDLCVVTDSNGDLAVNANVPSAVLDHIQNVTSDVQAQLDSKPSTTNSTTFSEDLATKKKLEIRREDGGNAEFSMKKQDGNNWKQFQILHKGSYVQIKLSNDCRVDVIQDGRVTVNGYTLNLPYHDGADNQFTSFNAANLKGALFCDTSAATHDLMFYAGDLGWKKVKLE